MSLGQPALLAATGVGTAPKLKILASAHPLHDPNTFTFMGWTCHTGGIDDAYADIFAIRAPGEVLGCTSHVVSGARRFSLGDEGSDIDGGEALLNGVWYHVAMVCTDLTGTVVRALGYVNGHLQCEGTLIPPVTPDVVAIWNGRESDTDFSGIWVGNMAGVKIWSGVALSAAEIRREMGTYMARRKAGVWACTPLRNLATHTHNYGGTCGIDWATQSVYFFDGTTEPSGVAWDVGEPRAFTPAPRRWILGSH